MLPWRFSALGLVGRQMGSQFFNTVQPYRAPDWAEGLALKPEKRLVLCISPTPIYPWHPPGVPQDFQLSIKRDDLTGSTLSGNKVRKLEFIFADLLEKGCDSVVTAGGIQSNHCRTTALVAAQCGVQPHVVLIPDEKGITEPSDIGYIGNILLTGLAGARISLLPRDEYEAAPDIMQYFADSLTSYSQELKKKGMKPYIIPVGGASPLGEWGYIEAFNEMIKQGILDDFDDIVLAGGSIGTAFGLAVANYLTGSKLKVHAVTVSLGVDSLHAEVDKLLSSVMKEQNIISSREILHIVDGYTGASHGDSTEEELVMIRDVAESTGVVLDPVFTVKAFIGMISEMKKDPMQFKGKRVLFLHTGGVYALFDGRCNINNILQKTKIARYEDFFS